MKKENFYETLGVLADAPREEIEKKLHEELRKWNYRLNAPTLDRRQEAEQMIEKLEEIKEILLDEEKRKVYDQELLQDLEKEETSEKETSGDLVIPPSQSPLSEGKSPEEKKLPIFSKWSKQKLWLIGSLSTIVLVGVLSFIDWNQFENKEISTSNEERTISGKALAQEIKTFAQKGMVDGIEAGIGDPVSKIEREMGKTDGYVGQARTWKSNSSYSFYEENNKIIAIVVGQADHVQEQIIGSSAKYKGLPDTYKNINVKNIEEVFGQPTVKSKINYVGDSADVYYYQLNEKVAIDFIVVENKVIFFRIGDHQQYFGKSPKDEIGRQTRVEELPRKDEELPRESTESPDLANEIKEYAMEGKVYGVPFGIGATVEEVKAAWGEPESGNLMEEVQNYYPDKYVSLKICEQKVCEITVGRIENESDGVLHPMHSLPPRYESLTFDQVERVLGDDYAMDVGLFALYTYKLSNYELNFSVPDDLPTNKTIVSFSVSKPSSSVTTSLQTKITQEDIDQVRERTKIFCEGYFYFVNPNSGLNIELPDDYFHPQFDRNAREEKLKELQAPNRAGIVLDSIQVKELEVFINESVIGMDEDMLASIAKMKVEYTRSIDNEVYKDERNEDYIIFWTKDENLWKVVRLEPYDPDAIYDY